MECDHVIAFCPSCGARPSEIKEPQAFPRPGVGSEYAGMTLRDYFAAAAMQGLLSKLDENNEHLGKRAYAVADRMMTVRWLIRDG